MSDNLKLFSFVEFGQPTKDNPNGIRVLPETYQRPLSRVLGITKGTGPMSDEEVAAIRAEWEGRDDVAMLEWWTPHELIVIGRRLLATLPGGATPTEEQP